MSKRSLEIRNSITFLLCKHSLFMKKTSGYIVILISELVERENSTSDSNVFHLKCIMQIYFLFRSRQHGYFGMDEFRKLARIS